MDKWEVRFEANKHDVHCGDCGALIPAEMVREKISAIDKGQHTITHFCYRCVNYGGEYETGN